MGTLEYRVNWSSGGTNPGLSVFHAREQGGAPTGLASQDFADKVRAFFEAIKTVVGGSVTWSFPGEVLVLDTSTGTLTDVQSVTPPANVLSTVGTAYAAPAGARLEWRTPAIVAGRRLRGRTFIVPLLTSSYETNGTLLAASITTLTTAAAAYINTSLFTNVAPSVYSRTHGIQADITSLIVPDEVSILRSRRE